MAFTEGALRRTTRSELPGSPEGGLEHRAEQLHMRTAVDLTPPSTDRPPDVPMTREVARQDDGRAPRRSLRPVSLRLRLVAALVVLLALGLAVFGYATYTVYKRAQYEELDDQVRASMPILEGLLRTDGAARRDDDGDGDGAPPGGPPRIISPGTYAELRLADGTVVNPSQLPGEMMRGGPSGGGVSPSPSSRRAAPPARRRPSRIGMDARTWSSSSSYWARL